MAENTLSMLSLGRTRTEAAGRGECRGEGSGNTAVLKPVLASSQRLTATFPAIVRQSLNVAVITTE